MLAAAAVAQHQEIRRRGRRALRRPRAPASSPRRHASASTLARASAARCRPAARSGRDSGQSSRAGFRSEPGRRRHHGEHRGERIVALLGRRSAASCRARSPRTAGWPRSTARPIHTRCRSSISREARPRKDSCALGAHAADDARRRGRSNRRPAHGAAASRSASPIRSQLAQFARARRAVLEDALRPKSVLRPAARDRKRLRDAAALLRRSTTSYIPQLRAQRVTRPRQPRFDCADRNSE